MYRTILESRLRAVCVRKRIRILYESVTGGLFFAGLLLLLFFGAHLIAGRTLVSPSLFIALGIIAGIFGGLAIGLLTPVDRLETAREIDRYYDLKDRVLTASQIGKNGRPGAMENLLMEDAARSTDAVEPKRIVPYPISGELGKVFGIFLPVLVLCLFVIPGSSRINQAAVIPNETVLAILDQLRSDLAEPLEELARDNPEEERLGDLNGRVALLMEQLEQHRSDPREALLTLHRLEKDIAGTIREFDLEATDISMKELGEALSLAEATRSAGEALIGGDYEKGAEQLENTDFEGMSNRERQTVGNQLEKVADAMERRKQAQLARMTQKLSDDMKKGDCANCKNTACQFAGTCRKQCARKGACDKLNCQLAKLGLCKSQCAGACSNCPNKGKCASQSGSQSVASSEASQAGGDQASGTTNAGSDVAGAPLGEETGDLASYRERQKITGARGEGDSETQTLKADAPPEGETGASAQTSYQKRLAEYRKRAEAVLETESVPFEQRQVVLRYFESIVPGNPDSLENREK